MQKSPPSSRACLHRTHPQCYPSRYQSAQCYPFASRATSLAGAFLAHSSLSSFYAPPVRSILRTTLSLRHQHVWSGAMPSHGKQGEVPKACRRCQATHKVRGRAGMQASGARIIPVKVVG